ncbi:unnamed protein product [Ceratitis capitata]|uniref:(Mediterranean fruit fly) hypothetical protein n=1 Tax=Ceratitis capitata TaxID=7213 RepID=A0A811U6N7_CERCA|nr:unnamed protein product [Ceratitis capitata]
MLNGKFYTGLPPGMIDRGSTQRNRLQSSIFWPDDTKVDSAVETRVKRRNSLQIAQAERPRLRMQSSVSGVDGGGGCGDADVNTRQLFQKEFSKSSIEFLDNLGDETKVRKPLLFRAGRSGGNEVTPKPTAMKLPLPENVVNAGYTTAKKKQAFTSKIEFYDYVGDELNNRNNLRRSKMDMNDKKEMERNTKNSPKLQVKNNVRNLSANEKLYPAVRSGKSDLKQGEYEASADAKLNNNRRVEVSERANERYDEDAAGADEEYEIARHNVTGIKVSPNTRGSHLRDLEFLESRRTVSPEYGYRRQRRFQESYEDDYETPDYPPSARYGRVATVRRANSVGRFIAPPKRILKNPIRERRYYDEYGSGDYKVREIGRDNARYGHRANELYERNPEAVDDVDYMERRMRDMDLRRASPKKHVTYSDDTYSHDDEMPSQSRSLPPLSAQSRNRASASIPAANMRTGSNSQQRQQQQELRRYNSEIDIVDDVNETFVGHKFMETDMHDNATTTTTNATHKPLNNRSVNNTLAVGDEERNRLVNKINNNNSNSNKNNNYHNHTTTTWSRLNNQTISSAARKITPKSLTTKQNADMPTPTQDAEVAAAAVGTGTGTGVKKHLRSSLCLHNGEIIASDDGGAMSAKAAPTRNARTTATRQRISVGLPD